MKYRNIVWDWNGTLLNDLNVGVQTLNDMLSRRGLSSVSVEEYKELFEFPVLRFYERIGFNLEGESFHDLSVDFVETYDRYAQGVALNQHVPEVLKSLQQTGLKQFVLSALREDLLHQMIRNFAIDSYFDGLCGSDNIYAAGKVERGHRMLKTWPLVPAETLMVGDTLHDAEVAKELGFDCVLFAGGHNSVQRLACVAPVIRSFEELHFYI